MIRQKIFFDPKNFSNIQEATNIKLKWYVNNNDRVHVGTPIVRIILEGYDQPQVHVINSIFEGFCHVLNPDTSPFNFPKGELAYIADDMMDFIYPYVLDKQTDLFTNEPSIEWKQVSGIETTVGIPITIKNVDALYINNCFKNGKMFLVFNFATKYLKVKKMIPYH